MEHLMNTAKPCGVVITRCLSDAIETSNISKTPWKSEANPGLFRRAHSVKLIHMPQIISPS